MPVPVKYARMWNRELHTCDMFNFPTRILAAFFSLMLPVLAITGPLIWWNRRSVTKSRLLASERELQPLSADSDVSGR